jgi:general secretion pathway protein C
MWTKGWAFLIWAAAAAAAAFWGLRVWGESPQPPGHALPAPAAAVVSGDLTRVLGANPAAPAPEVDAAPPSADQARFQLVGVIAAGASGASGRAAGPAWATLSVDGKPARTYRVGSVVDGSYVLQKVAARGVEIGPRGGAPALTLKLAPPPAAATGRPGMPANGAAPAVPAAPATSSMLPGMQAPPSLAPVPQPPVGSGLGSGAGSAAGSASGDPAAGNSETNPTSTAVRRPGLATR